MNACKCRRNMMPDVWCAGCAPAFHSRRRFDIDNDLRTRYFSYLQWSTKQAGISF